MQHLLLTCVTTSTAIYSVSQFQGLTRPANPAFPSQFQDFTKPVNPVLPITISGAHKASEPCPSHHNFRGSQGQWTLSSPSGFQGFTRPVNPVLPFRISGTHKTSPPPLHPPLKNVYQHQPEVCGPVTASGARSPPVCVPEGGPQGTGWEEGSALWPWGTPYPAAVQQDCQNLLHTFQHNTECSGACVCVCVCVRMCLCMIHIE